MGGKPRRPKLVLLQYKDITIKRVLPNLTLWEAYIGDWYLGKSLVRYELDRRAKQAVDDLNDLLIKKANY